MSASGEYREEPLSRHTTIRIGGPAERLLVPQERSDLLDILRTCARTRTPFFILGRGSNTLVKDSGVKGIVIKNTASCTELDVEGNTVRAGSSVTLQRLVRFCIGNNLEGMEYLYSVPGNVGGAVYMNAGRGIAFNQSIADRLVSAEVFDGQKVRTLAKEECGFGYRTSVFQRQRGWVVLSATLRLPSQDRQIGEAKVRERMEYVKAHHDLAFPNAGTVFRENFVPLPEVIGYRIGNACFSTKTPGWIVNLGGATARDVHMLIRHAVRCHRRRSLPAPQLEIVLTPELRWRGFWKRALSWTVPSQRRPSLLDSSRGGSET